MNYLIGSLMLMTVSACALHPAPSKEQIVAKAIAFSEKPNKSFTAFEVEAALISGSKESLGGWLDMTQEVQERWVNSLLGRPIWHVLVCPTRTTGQVTEREYCVHSRFDAQTGELLLPPH